jgi:hypothetical protein
MKRGILISILLILLAACDKMDISPSQADSFVKFYNTYSVFSGADVKEIPGKGYAVIGTVESYTSGRQICLIRTDEFGNSLDSARYYGGSLDEQAYCLHLLDDAGYALLGSSTNPITSKKEVLFIRTDSTGNILWSRTISGTGNIEAFHFEVSPTGSFIMTGYADTLKSGVVDKDIWLFGLSANGNNIENWPRPRLIGGEKDDIGSYLQILSDGRIAITGQSNSYPSSLNSHAFVIITNSIGGVKIPFWIESATNEAGNCIRTVGDNGFIVVGTSASASSGSAREIMMKKVTITASNTQINWEKTYYTGGNNFGQRVIPDDNSLNLLVSIVSSGVNSSLALLTTNLDGSNPKFSFFGDGSQLTGNALEKTLDNGFIITGTNKHSDNNMSMVLIKLKSDGTLK